MRTWIFQANPDRYRIGESLKVNPEELWNLNQHAKDVHQGDRVLIWISGSDAGVYAIGKVLTEPRTMSDSSDGLKYWVVKDDGRKPKPRVKVRYDRLLLDRPLRKAYLEFDPNLKDMSILRSPRGTNFAIEDHEWRAIEWYIENE